MAESPGSSGMALRRAVQTMSERTKTRIFGAGYVIVALMVLLPPLYLAASAKTPIVLGLPFSVFYMLLNAVLITALVTTLWFVEGARGEREVFEEQ